VRFSRKAVIPSWASAPTRIAAITSAVLLSLGAQADEQHAGALMSSQVAAGQQLCAAPARAERS